MSIAADQVTALVPVWGSYAGEHLDEALSSLVSQDVSARIVVIDNASDLAVEVSHDVEVLRAPTRLTLGGVRNFGLSHVSTPFVLVWDADDVMLPGTLGFLIERLQGADDCVALAAGIVDGTTGRRYRWPRPWMTRLVKFPRVFALLQCAWSAYPTTGATLMRTEKVLEAGGYTDAVSASDWGLGAALAFRGRLCWSERPGRIYRRRPGSVWALNSGLSRLLDHSRTVRRRVREDPGIPSWAHALLPLIAVAQYVTLFILRPPRLLARALVSRARGTVVLGVLVSLVFAASASAGPPDHFNSGAAWNLVRKQLSYGQRPAGSVQLQRLARGLRARLPNGTFEPLPGEAGLRNVVGTIPGRKPAIVIGAHYDTLADPPGFVGANNGAAGTAVVVEAARALAAMRLQRSGREIRFVLFDGEEPPRGLPEDSPDFYSSGLRGSRAYVAAHPGEMAAMVLLDYVGNKDLLLPREESSNRGLWSRLRKAARSVGAGSIFPSSSGPLFIDDHTPFLRAGVPAIDLIDPGYDGHSASDRLDKLSRASLDAVGETVVALALTLR